jgi:hypothetical protein
MNGSAFQGGAASDIEETAMILQAMLAISFGDV